MGLFCGGYVPRVCIRVSPDKRRPTRSVRVRQAVRAEYSSGRRSSSVRSRSASRCCRIQRESACPAAADRHASSGAVRAAERADTRRHAEVPRPEVCRAVSPVGTAARRFPAAGVRTRRGVHTCRSPAVDIHLSVLATGRSAYAPPAHFFTRSFLTTHIYFITLRAKSKAVCVNILPRGGIFPDF